MKSGLPTVARASPGGRAEAQTRIDSVSYVCYNGSGLRARLMEDIGRPLTPDGVERFRNLLVG